MSQPDDLTETTPDAPASRRRAVRGLVGGLAVSLAAVAGVADPADAVEDRRKTGQWHRCARHPRHTCWHKRRCPHRHHKRRSSGKSGGKSGGKHTTRHGIADPPGGLPSELPGGNPPVPKVPDSPPAPDGKQPPPPSPPGKTSIPPVGSALPVEVQRVIARFTAGYSVDLHDQITSAGTVDRWFDRQLDPSAITDGADELVTWWPSLSMGHGELWQAHLDGSVPGWVAMQDYARWVLVRRIYSSRQVHEVMTEFWEDHLHIPLNDDFVFPYRADYGMTIRRHALGRFADLLKAATTHPAMSLSLDNAFSTRWAPNENLGRELLELHTVGAGNFDEDDVKSSARILTGYQVDVWGTWDATYREDLHWTGPVEVLDFRHANQSSDGRPVVEAYLDYLAHHPLTARRIARKLACRFISDDPPASLVDRLAAAYLANDTEIRPVLRALLNAPEFAAAPVKVRTPVDDVAATYRALGVRMNRPTSEQSGANALLWYAWALGQGPFDWPRPDGPPVDGVSWSGTSRVLSAMDFHLVSAAGAWPQNDTTFLSYGSWLGSTPLTLSDLVDRISLRLYARQATALVRQACSEAIGLGPTTVVDPAQPGVDWVVPYLLAVLLDSPAHMLR